MHRSPESTGLLGWIGDWSSGPPAGILAAFLLAGVVYLIWRRVRGNFARGRHYREREKLRRDYWGWGE
jgi:hypothetical protein